MNMKEELVVFYLLGNVRLMRNAQTVKQTFNNLRSVCDQERSPRMRRASCMSLGMMVTRLA